MTGRDTETMVQLPFVPLSLARLGTHSVLRNLFSLHHNRPSEYLHFRAEKTDSRVVTCGKFMGQKSEPQLLCTLDPCGRAMVALN